MRIEIYVLVIFSISLWCLVFLRLQGGSVVTNKNVVNVVKNMRGVHNTSLPTPSFSQFLEAQLIHNNLDVKKEQDKIIVSQTLYNKTMRCTIDTTKIHLNRNKVWSDIFETDASVLENQTQFSKEEIRQILAYSLLPDENASIAVVARGKNIPLNDTVVRFNTHDSDQQTDFRFTWGFHLPELLKKFDHGITSFRWIHSKRYIGIWNTSSPLVIPKSIWSNRLLKRALATKTPMYFLKTNIWAGKKSWLPDCRLVDGVGFFTMGLLIRLKYRMKIYGFSMTSDEYNFPTHPTSTHINRWKGMVHANIFKAILDYGE